MLVVDESVNGLDPEGIVWVRNLMKDLAGQGRTVFVSSHLMKRDGPHRRAADRDRPRALIADCATDQFMARSSQRSVLVKSPDAARLTQLLTAEGGLVAVPQRVPMLAAKSVVFAVLVFVVGELVAFRSFFVGAAILHGKAPVSLGEAGVLRAVAGSGLYLAVLGLFALAIGRLPPPAPRRLTCAGPGASRASGHGVHRKRTMLATMATRVRVKRDE